ncbi:DUF6879 family protein [Streptacidiphilus cavernicola]|uniref:DUF6879 family protein n=1 Tax=Streptacidiphilus cavernicola TaxID=3342716 RepID=A0ABV6W478_9ACTN
MVHGIGAEIEDPDGWVWELLLLHECAHLAVARAVGVPGRIRFGTRLQFLVLQTDISGIEFAPRRQRLTAYLAGMGFNLATAAVAVLLLAAGPVGDHSLTRRLLSILVLWSLLPLTFELMVFLRTDVYFVLQDLTRCRDLYGDGRAYARYLAGAALRTVRRVGRSAAGQALPPRPQGDAVAVPDPSLGLPAGERRAVRLYSAVLVLGCGVCLGVMAAFTLPVDISLFMGPFGSSGPAVTVGRSRTERWYSPCWARSTACGWSPGGAPGHQLTSGSRRKHMLGILDNAEGRRLDFADYVADFDERFWSIGSEGFWKLERGQSFQEPGVESWELLRDGDWVRSLDLIERQRQDYTKHLDRIFAAGFSHHRVRVVERPVTPYLQWELHVLRAKDQCGEDVRVVPAADVAGLEQQGPLPELVVLGADAVYEVLYTGDGLPDGARRFTDPTLVAGVRALIQRLHASGEPLADYFAREIAVLAPPCQ